MQEKQLLFSLSKDKGDFIVEAFRAGGKGGQKQDKTSSACRIKHPASGTIAESREERSFFQNRKIAFKRLTETKEFQQWYKIEVSRRTGQLALIEDEVNRQMQDKYIKVEFLEDGKWKVVSC